MKLTSNRDPRSDRSTKLVRFVTKAKESVANRHGERERPVCKSGMWQDILMWVMMLDFGLGIDISNGKKNLNR
ncbi:hypothetical protein WA026_010461 [Henosepilachna vigintioctopunctata]|uniref:Uncharacterized protein n=1 Tax=Henosepilachna vigintioctopunctata TaxID=420089 RepID=A0AAW1VAB5_9CUCU